MKIDHLRNFLAVAEKLNFSKAADDLCISQSSLSKHIISLENELNVRLFNRSTHGIKLTDAGLMMKMYAEKILDDYDELFSAIQRFKNKKHFLFIPYQYLPVMVFLKCLFSLTNSILI